MQDAINQVFALFRVNFHNQYHAAFGDTEVVNQAKRLWFESLQHFSPAQILKAARQIIEEAEYLPSLQKMMTACEDQLLDLGLPNLRDAYLEACNATSPRVAYHWSHPAVYFAGKETGWHLLTHGTEAESYRHFVRAYRQQIRRVLAGEKLEIDAPLQLEEKPSKPLSVDEKKNKIRAIRSDFNN